MSTADDAQRRRDEVDAEASWIRWSDRFVRPIFTGSALDWNNLQMAYIAGYVREGDQ